MATQKQIQANRNNALLSTGPRTDQGKAVSRWNALKTSIDARNEAASCEDPAALAELTDEYYQQFHPMGVVERLLVDTLVKDDWFLRRYRFLAADLVNHTAGIAYESKKGADFGSGFANNTDSFHRIHRHIIDLERSFFTHLAELERRQTTRRRLEPEVEPPVTDSPQKENPEIGFVPQSAPTASQAGRTASRPQVANPPVGSVESAAPRYTGNSDCISPIRPWQK